MVTVHEKVQYWFSNDASKPVVTEKNICEGTDCLKSALQSDMKGYMLWVPQQEVLSGEAIEQ